MKKSRGIAVLLLTAIVTVFFCYTAAVGIGPTGTGSAKNINTGLDLAGGVSITYQAKDSNPSKEDMSDTVYKMQQRVLSTVLRHRYIRKVPTVSPLRFQEYQMQMRFWKNLESQVLCILSIRQMQTETRISTGNRMDMFSARSMDDIQKAGSVVLEGTDVADAEGGAYQDSNTSQRNM